MKLADYLKVEGRRVKVVERGPAQRAAFWPRLLALAPWLELEFEHASELPNRRTELFGSGSHGSIAFVGDIEDQQLSPLLEALRTLATGRVQWTAADTAAEVRALERAVDLDLFVSPLCPFCVTVSSAALRFAAASPAVSVRILRADAVGLPEQVHTLPTLLADGEIVAQGAAEEPSLIRQIGVYQRAVAPASGVVSTRPRPLPSTVRNSAPVASTSPGKQRRPRSTAA